MLYEAGGIAEQNTKSTLPGCRSLPSAGANLKALSAGTGLWIGVSGLYVVLGLTAVGLALTFKAKS